MKLTTTAGERLRNRMRNPTYRYGRTWGLGLEARCVSFADHRSGTSALQVVLQLGYWLWHFYPITWPTPRQPYVPVVSLREQLEQTHGKRQTRKDDDDDAPAGS